MAVSTSDEVGPGAPPVVDAEEAARLRRRRVERLAKWTLPVVVFAASILIWHLYVTLWEVPHYILPGPTLVGQTLIEDRVLLFDTLMVTARLTLMALGLAVMGGVLLAVAFTQSKWAEMSFFPYAVVLQVTPVIAVAPLIKIYVDSTFAAALICAWIVAFFPILSNTTIGLKSADHNLRDLFSIYGATRWQRLRLLQAPAALPYFLSGLKIAGGLALIGAVVAEFVIGRAGSDLGIAALLLEASYRFNFGRLFAALVLISGLGVVIFGVLSAVSHLMLRKWHESAVARER